MTRLEPKNRSVNVGTGNCEDVRQLLHGVAYGEAGPQDAMLTARHVSDCTACRILLARERRLAAMLDDGFEDHVRVGEEFLQGVMAHLPQGPPPSVLPRRLERQLKLA